MTEAEKLVKGIEDLRKLAYRVSGYADRCASGLDRETRLDLLGVLAAAKRSVWAIEQQVSP